MNLKSIKSGIDDFKDIFDTKHILAAMGKKRFLELVNTPFFDNYKKLLSEGERWKGKCEVILVFPFYLCLYWKCTNLYKNKPELFF